MFDIKIIDKNFVHAKSFGNGNTGIYPTKIHWYRGNENRKMCFFTDGCLPDIQNKNINKGRINVAWLLEPPSISKITYDWISVCYGLFDYVLTYDKSLLKTDKRFVWYPHVGCWIEPKDFKVYDKSKNISIIASDKKTTEGHKLRHQVIKELGNKIDLICGGGYKPINYKLEALKDYKYSIIIENGQYDTYFTEKIIDCFVTGTIPIYWGCYLNGLFDDRGILYFNNIEELNKILISIKNNIIKYEDMISAVNMNFEFAKKYTITEDWIADNFIRKII